MCWNDGCARLIFCGGWNMRGSSAAAARIKRMHIREYQAWLEQWDKSRTWEQVTLGHTLMHAVEELGEVSKIVQMIEGYRAPQPADPHALRDELALELSDLQVMLFKI